MTVTMRRTGAAALMALAPVAFFATRAITRGDIGPRIATHFRLGGEPDGYSSTSGFVLGIGVACVLLATAGVAAIWFSRTVARPFAGALAGGTWVLSGVGISVLLAGRGVAPADARSGWGVSVATLVAGVAFGYAVAWLLPPAVSTLTPAGAEPAYHLAPRERASWFGSARSKAILAIGLVVAVAGVVIFVLGHVAGAFVCLVGLIAVWLHSLEVRVDADGVTAHFGPVAWPRVRVPLAGIAAVEAQEIEPTKWGGWGYRLGRRGTALVVRRGPGLVIARTGAADLAITVDDPQGAVDLINALLARESTEQPS